VTVHPDSGLFLIVVMLLQAPTRRLGEKWSRAPVAKPQALKRGHIFNDLTARVKLVPFPFV
jgi:hypothetical protein